MKKIWIVGGEDIHMRLPLLKLLKFRGFDVTAVGTGPGTAFIGNNIPYFEYKMNRFLSPISDHQTIKELTNLFIKHKPDVVHGVDTKPAIFTAIAGNKANIKGIMRTITGMGYIFSSHSPLAFLLKPIYRYLQRKADKFAHLTVFQNPDDQDYFVRHNMITSDRSRLILGSGIDLGSLNKTIITEKIKTDLKQQLGLNNEVVFLMIARLVKHKGVVEYLKAARETKLKTNKKTCFLLVGPTTNEGGQAVSLDTIKKYRDDVVYLGARNDVPVLLTISDVFALPTYYREGVPRVLMEASVMGLPLVTTDMPGCREVALDDVTGLIIPPRNSTKMADAFVKLAENKKLRQRLGAAGSTHIKNGFTLEQVAEQYIQIYNSLIN
jgi:glycosyltransferase involved in cell wall biosynthesis